MEYAMLVMAHLEAAAGRRIKEHARFIADHQDWMHHFQSKLNALTDIIMRCEGGAETRE
ncbi:MAG: hypothetical protein JO033_28710 [Acidobacteriaceae bacterium]|nr:hypothetical protein [Acidobacteriaceae bacterium]MBV9501616.1 hypothetical protein [Acidobacteriaceae bacterium]